MDKKKYGIFRIEKIKLCDGGEIMGRLKHAYREFKIDSFDPELSKLNETFKLGSSKETIKAYKERIKSITTDKYKPPKNAVGIYECIFTSTAGAIPKDREQEFFEKTLIQLSKTFGEENVLAGTVHRDETTVHTHWFITPIFNTTSILRRTKEEKKNGTFRSITQPQLNATHWTGSPALMSQLQDRMWEGVFQHFGLERGEVELTPDRKKKKRNVRSDIHKRDVLLKEKEESLEIREKEQTKVVEKLVAIEMELEEKKTNLCKSESEFQKEKIDFISEMATVGQNAVKEYNELKGSENFGNGDFPELPQPEAKENIWHYHLKIKPIFDAVVFKAKYFFQQIKELRENHREEVKRLKESHDKDLESVKAKASVEKQNAVQKAIQKKSDEMQKTIDNLKKEIQGEKKEKEKWYNIIFNKFSMRIDGKNVEVNKGLKDAYIEKSLQLEEWENRNSDELLSLGIKYKKFKVRNWREYLVARSKPKTVDCDMVR